MPVLPVAAIHESLGVHRAGLSAILAAIATIIDLRRS